MSITEGRWEGNTSFPDSLGEWGMGDFIDTSTHAVATLNANGDASYNLASTLAGTFVTIINPMRRAGVYASAYDQQQFGTAAGVAGPSSVAGTSGPLALKPGFPPLTAAQLPTLGAIQTGPIPKGFQIDSVDVCYQVSTVNASLAQFGLYTNQIKNGVANSPTALVALGTNGLATAFNANPYVKNIVNPSPAMIVTPDTFIVVQVNLTAGSGGTIKFWGIEVYGHFNYN